MRTQRPSSYGQIDTAYPAAGYGVEERTWPFACLNKLVKSVGVRIEDISDLMGHSGTSVTETVYRHEIRPALTTGATAMNQILKIKQTTPVASRHRAL